MPQIIVTSDPRQADTPSVVLIEPISIADLESDRGAGRLVERIGWALVAAAELEHGRRSAPRRTALRRLAA